MNQIPEYRLDHILHKGDHIHTEGAVYTITGEPLGFGGTSVLYPAISDGSKLEIAIKEAFPGGAARYHRCGGVIRPTDPNDVIALGQLEQYRKQIKKEMELGQTIRNSSVRAIGLWKNLVPSSITVDGKNYTEVSDGIYSILERMDRKGKTFNQLLQYISEPPSEYTPLKTGYLPKIHTTALIMEQVLLALQRVHTAGENGFLFGDIQDGNVFFSDCRLEQGDIGIGNLLDFGCARPLVDGKQTEEITDRQIFSTAGFIPPEILDPEKNNSVLRLTRAADIYSVGCLMLRCLLSPASIKLLGASPVVDDEAIDEEAASRLSCTESIRNLLNLILQKALQTEPEDRYLDTEAMLADIRKLKRDTAPPTYLLPKAPGSSTSFVEGSRDREIREIMGTLKENAPAFVWGCGGIGKSEIAIKVAEEFEKRSPKGAYFIHYTVPTNKDQEAMEETVLRMPFSGYKYEPKQGMSLEEQRKAEYKARIHILREHYAGALLVIDNFEWAGKTWEDLTVEKSYLEMEAIGLNLLFTTRSKVPGTPGVKELSREDLLRLMRQWVTDLRITDRQLYDLIDAVDGHTLTVDLIAKCLSRSRRKVPPEMMLECLQNHKLAEVKYPVTHRAIVKGEDPERLGHRDPKTAQIYEHLKALFDLSGLDEQMKTILCYATLLPESGMDCLLFESCLEEGQEKPFEYLLYCGWFTNSNDNVLSIHPLIREVCRKELNPDDEKCDIFLNSIWSLYKQLDYHADKYRQIAHLFNNAAVLLPDINCYYAMHAGCCFAEIGVWTQAKELISNIIPCLERRQNGPAEQLQLASCYDNLSWLNGSLGMYYEAIEYSKKCLKILEPIEMSDESFEELTPQVLDSWNHVVATIYDLLANAYDNIGYAYGKLKDAEQSLNYVEKALRIREKHLTPPHIGLVNSYNNLAACYLDLNNPRNALRYSLMALDMIPRVALPSDPTFATVYRNVGIAYGQTGNAAKELHYCTMAVEICEKVLPKDHPEMADAYFAVAHAYKANGNKQKSLRYQKRAVAIMEEKLSPEHPKLLEYKLNLAVAYGEVGNLKRKLDLLLELEHVMRTHNLEQLSSLYAIIGAVYASMDNVERVEHYLLLHHIHKSREH